MSFEVDPNHLRAHGRAIEATGAEAVVELDRFHGETEAGGYAPWGTDFTTNAVISALYAELTSLTGEALGLVGEGLGYSGVGLSQMADTYQHVDESSGRDISGISDGLQGST
jgi:hypothetical protein